MTRSDDVNNTNDTRLTQSYVQVNNEEAGRVIYMDAKILFFLNFLTFISTDSNLLLSPCHPLTLPPHLNGEHVRRQQPPSHLWLPR